MKLYLVQHGEALSKEQDPDRALSEVGVADVEHMANFLQQAGIRVSRVIHSGKTRALQTASRLAEAIAPSVEVEASGIIQPNDDPEAFAWQHESWDQDTLIVGHLPFMAKLVSLLLIGAEDKLLTQFVPGTVVCLEKTGDEHWVLSWMLRPDLLAR